MNQHQFEKKYQPHWDQFLILLEQIEATSKKEPEVELSLEEFPIRYRQLCNHYGLAQVRHYSPALVDRLHSLVLRGHRQLYRTKTGLLWTILKFIVRDFPVTLRKQYRLFWIAFLLFYMPAIGVGIGTYSNPTLTYSLMGESQVVLMESMYNPENRKSGRSFEREDETDLEMFGYYIFNNISIGFRTFAGGIVFGLGSVFLLIFNGLMIGGVAGHLSHSPFAEIFWPFVCGHGPFELTAIVIAGSAGLLLGYSLLRPGPYRRIDSLRLHAPIALKLVMGAALMLVCAAFIEAFWSPSEVSEIAKYCMAAVNALLVTIYFLFAGRSRHES